MNHGMFADGVLKAALERKGFRVTSQRLAICRSLVDARHPTAQKVFEGVKKTHPGISLATVYNTLGVLKQLNLVHELALTRGEKRYDSNVRPHMNVFCVECGEISDVKARSACEMLMKAAAKEGFTVNEQCVDIHGICGECKQSSKLKWK